MHTYLEKQKTFTSYEAIKKTHQKFYKWSTCTGKNVRNVKGRGITENREAQDECLWGNSADHHSDSDDKNKLKQFAMVGVHLVFTSTTGRDRFIDMQIKMI